MKIFGVHINSDPNHILDELDKVKNIGGNLVQLFVDPGYKEQSIYNQFKEKLIKNKMYCVVHASYTINLASYWDQYSWSIKQFILEIELAHKIGAFGVVIHMGKQMELSIEEAYNNMFTGLLYVHNQTKKYQNVRILLETSTGQGSEICYKIEDFSHFYKKLSHHNNEFIKNRFKMCLDTCHIFAAGYDIRTKQCIEIYLDTLEELIGIKNIGLIHLNDSKLGLGEKRDRHQSLGEGNIGSIGLKLMAKFFQNLEIAIILETPNENLFESEIRNYLLN